MLAITTFFMSIRIIFPSLFLHSTSTHAFTKSASSTFAPSVKKRSNISFVKSSSARFLTSDSNALLSSFDVNISRLSKLQTLLQKAGAPGSLECNIPNDLEPVSEMNLHLHPHLFPIARSKSNPDHYVCGLRRACADDSLYVSSTNSPWPIVESKVNGMGYNLLSLNSEQMMRRIVAQIDSDRDEDKNDAAITADKLINIYNEDLGKGQLTEKSLDVLYEPGSVTKLGYGASKYVLLRVGPFPDLYEGMKNDYSQRACKAE